MTRERIDAARHDNRRGYHKRDRDKNVRRYRINLCAIQRLCEINYARLLVIASEALWQQVGTTVLLPQRRFNSMMTICEQTRYTTVISLAPEERLENKEAWWSTQPHLMIRLYHDVRMAEVIAANQYHNLAIYYDYPNPHMHQPDEKYQLNHLLAEWLIQLECA